MTRSGTKRPPTENATTVTSDPGTASSTRHTGVRAAASASSTAAGSSSGPRTSASPFWPCRSGAFNTHGKPSSATAARASPRSRQTRERGCGTPASANRSRWRIFEVASTAVSGEIGCETPSRYREPGGDPDRPVDPGRDHAVDALREGEALDGGLVLDRDERPLVGEPKSRRRRVAVERDHLEPAPARGLEQAELRRPRP